MECIDHEDHEEHKKILWYLRDYTYKMIKCGLIKNENLYWGKPFTKGID